MPLLFRAFRVGFPLFAVELSQQSPNSCAEDKNELSQIIQNAH